MDGKTTQQKILDSIIESGRTTSRDLSKKCGIDEPTVRYHLRKLRNLGLVEVIPGKTNNPQAGRRASIVLPVAPDDDSIIKELFFVLLSDWAKERPSPAIHLADLFLNDEHQIVNNSVEKKIRIRELIIWLNEHHYNAIWEAGKHGPEIVIKRCPYRTLHNGLDVFCEMDMWIMRKLGGLPWILKEQMDQESMTGICRFVVNETTRR